MPRVSFLFSWYYQGKAPMIFHLTLWRHWKFISPDTPHIRKRQRDTDSTSQTNSHSRSATSSQHGNLPIPRGSIIVGNPGWRFPTTGPHMICSSSVCYCLERWFLTRPVHRDAWIYVQSRRLDGRNPGKSKVLGSSQTAWDQVTPNFTDFSPISNAFCADGTPSIGHSLEFPSPRVIEWDRGFYTSREMTVHVCYYFQLSGIIILAFKRTANTK